MNDLENKAADILDKLEKLTEAYAPEVVEKALQAVTVSGVSSVIYAVAGIILSILFYKIMIISVKFFERRGKEDGPYNDWDVGMYLSYVAGTTIIFVTLLENILTLINLWVWIAIFNPELALAHQILGL